MIQILPALKPSDFKAPLARFWELSGQKLRLIDEHYDTAQGSPVFTRAGKYTTRGWTEWTQGFQYGSALLQFDATGDQEQLDIARENTLERMAVHVTHTGVHDHGFNNVSTYGNLRRLMLEGKLPRDEWELNFYELALKCSGAVQASRWTALSGGDGYIYSFNGPQSLFADTIRSCRALAIAHRLGHVLQEENDRKVSLLGRLIAHARATAKYNVFFGKGRDAFDVRGRVAHESIFNVKDGAYRCPSTQQGYSPFSTWTRGLAWIMLGYAEELEFLGRCTDDELAPFGDPEAIEAMFLETAQATCDFYLENTPADGICYWDTGAPNLHKLGDYLSRPADPFNAYEPVDSSASVIAAQGLLRLGHYLQVHGHAQLGQRYFQAGLTVLKSLLGEPYLSTDENHQGLILHSIYHLPNGWDYVPPGQKTACGESSMWGDYHARELALYVQRLIDEEPYLTFWGA